MQAVAVLVVCCFQMVTLRPLSIDNTGWQTSRAVAAILSTNPPCEHATLFLTDGKKEAGMVQAPRGVTLFQAAAENLSVPLSNTSHSYLAETVDHVRQMGGAWHCLVVVVVSDDLAFLVAFAHLSLRRHALRWSTRVLVLTRLPLSDLGSLHGLLSTRNAMLLHVQGGEEAVSQVDVSVWQPYSAPSSRPMRVATWTPSSRLTLASHVSLFPDKFSVFSHAPSLTVAVELLPHTTLVWVDDPEAVGGRRLEYLGYVNNIVRYLAQAMNFTTRYVLSPERTFGTKLPDGSWTGMIGMVVREEADFATGPFITTLVRKQAADLSTTFYHGNVRIVSGLAGLRVDLWGFLLPLTPIVWTATLAALLGVLCALQVFSSCMPISAYKTLCQDSWSTNTFSPVRVLLQQDVVWPAQWWWWERLVQGLWMLTVLVLAKSYAGNLMSLLAVRYVPQPFQTLRDVLDHPSVVMIWQKFSSYEQFIRDVKHGQFREVAELEDEGRLLFHTQQEMREGLDTLVRRGSHVLIDVDINLKSRIALDFSQKGQCDFYISRDGFLPLSSAMMTQKTNPLVHGFNKRFHTAKDQGLITYWMENVPNFTQCENIPKKMLVNSSIFLHSIWGMFAVLAGGLAAGMLVLCAEVLVSLVPKSSQHQLT